MINQWIEAFFQETHLNVIGGDMALSPEYIGLKLFEQPIVGVADARDELFNAYAQDPNILYQKFVTPEKWLPNAKTVISIFLPYTQTVKMGNARNLKKPSIEWLHGRYEGQQLIIALSKFIQAKALENGHACVVPCIDSRFDSYTGTAHIKTPQEYKTLSNRDYWSSWSERHVAFATGLGTFGLSKNIITEKGAAGRFTSFITDIEMPITQRQYTDVYENCTKCGACIDNCPVHAITFEHGKLHTPCSRYLDWVLEQNAPRYACGKCQVKVPCQDSNPTRVNK